jgi:hypothetical protein
LQAGVQGLILVFGCGVRFHPALPGKVSLNPGVGVGLPDHVVSGLPISLLDVKAGNIPGGYPLQPQEDRRSRGKIFAITLMLLKEEFRYRLPRMESAHVKGVVTMLLEIIQSASHPFRRCGCLVRQGLCQVPQARVRIRGQSQTSLDHLWTCFARLNNITHTLVQ